MQRQTHISKVALRFYVGTRGDLVDRHAEPRSHTGFSMSKNRVTRSELQVLADLLNEPSHQKAYDAGTSPNEAWHARLAEIDANHAAIREMRCVDYGTRPQLLFFGRRQTEAHHAA
ncbi:MAG: hypothetical protein PHQ05_05055 [Sterolibacterium sp.]|nr:hypothetical protein [Sterolibacterium sp.]